MSEIVISSSNNSVDKAIDKYHDTTSYSGGNRSVSVSLKPKTEKVYIPHFKRNNKEKTYFAS